MSPNRPGAWPSPGHLTAPDRRPWGDCRRIPSRPTTFSELPGISCCIASTRPPHGARPAQTHAPARTPTTPRRSWPRRVIGISHRLARRRTPDRSGHGFPGRSCPVPCRDEGDRPRERQPDDQDGRRPGHRRGDPLGRTDPITLVTLEDSTAAIAEAVGTGRVDDEQVTTCTGTTIAVHLDDHAHPRRRTRGRQRAGRDRPGPARRRTARGAGQAARHRGDHRTRPVGRRHVRAARGPHRRGAVRAGDLMAAWVIAGYARTPPPPDPDTGRGWAYN